MALPAATPVTRPDAGSMVATPVAVLLQVPPEPLVVIDIVPGKQSVDEGAVIVVAVLFCVITDVATFVQPTPSVPITV